MVIVNPGEVSHFVIHTTITTIKYYILRKVFFCLFVKSFLSVNSMSASVSYVVLYVAIFNIYRNKIISSLKQ